MPPKTKRQKQLQLAAQRATEARQASKRAKVQTSESLPTVPEASASEPNQDMELSLPSTSRVLRSVERSASEDTTEDPSYDPEQDLSENIDLKLEQFVEEWVLHLDRDDKISLSLFICFHLEKIFQFTQTNAAEYASIMLGKSDRTIRQWRTDFTANNGEIPENKQGRYQRTGILWSSEELNKKATRFIQSNANVKGQPNLTSGDFCQWVNNDLLPNACLEPGFPRKVSIDTARKWMHHLGFEPLSSSKGMYFDGHEREDVVVARNEFVRTMCKIGFLHPDEAPTPTAQSAFPQDIALASSEQRQKTIVIFHDETTFNANECQTTQWGRKGEFMIMPKSKGSGIMISDFIDKNGYLSLTDEEFTRAKLSNPTIKQYARQRMEYGESREGYWNSSKFMKQIEEASMLAEAKYPEKDGYKLVWIFDHSSCHTAMADDALDAGKMNVNPGGKQPVMRDTVWAGKQQKMTFTLGIPKGLRRVLEERGINTSSLTGPQMKKILSNHDDFKNEKPKVITFLSQRGHTALFLPNLKFHPELNPIERVWGQAKRYSKAHCKYTLPSLRLVIDPALDSVTLENISNFHRKAKDYMFAYLEGHVAGLKLEEQVKSYKSHRKVKANA